MADSPASTHRRWARRVPRARAAVRARLHAARARRGPRRRPHGWRLEIVDRDSGRPLHIYRDRGDAVGRRHARRALRRAAREPLRRTRAGGRVRSTASTYSPGETASTQHSAVRAFALGRRLPCRLAQERQRSPRRSSSRRCRTRMRRARGGREMSASSASRCSGSGRSASRSRRRSRRRARPTTHLRRAKAGRGEPAPAAAQAPASKSAPAPPPNEAAPDAPARGDRSASVASGERSAPPTAARETSYAITVRFERASRTPQEIVAHPLRQPGEPGRGRHRARSFASVRAASPAPFPGDNGFVPDPPRAVSAHDRRSGGHAARGLFREGARASGSARQGTSFRAFLMSDGPARRLAHGWIQRRAPGRSSIGAHAGRLRRPTHARRRRPHGGGTIARARRIRRRACLRPC
jgi:hypothetical protein